MNDNGRDALVQAAMAGVPQARGMFRDYKGGMCAIGVIRQAAPNYNEGWWNWAGLNTVDPVLCEVCSGELSSEAHYIVHLNDDHDFDFLTIARKMP